MARRRAPSGPGSAEPTPFDRPAEPVLRLIDDFAHQARDGERAVLARAAGLLDRFEREARQAGAPLSAIKPARLGLAMLIDQRARATPGIKLSTWAVLATQQLFEGRDVSLERVRAFRRTAAEQGGAFADLERFLAEQVLARAEAARQGPRRREGARWGWIAAGSALALLLALAGYAVALEYRFHARILADFEQEAQRIGLDRPHEGAGLVARLDELSEAVDRVSRAAERAPFRRALVLPVGDSAAQARATYAQAVDRHVPGEIARAIETVLATEGDALALYDALRAWAVLTDAAPWQPAYLTGWLEARGAALGIGGLAAHAAALDGPDPEITPQDPVIMDQARGFAAETDEAARAWLELRRAEATRALPRWRPDEAVPGLATVAITRSGRPLEAGMPGLFTQAGWDHARDVGIGVAVRDARALGPGITGTTPPADNATPDRVLDRLHRETIAAWQDWLADLRVRPFRSREQAIRVSGTLARAENPLTQLLQEVWLQAGGADRRRSHDQQLRLAREFGPMIQYVEAGRMQEIARLFARLNVALGAADFREDRAAERLMDVADRARSVNALKAAPPIVVQIAEDVLAQSARAPDAGLSDNPLTRQWQQLVYPACRAAVDGRYPFADGPSADLDALAALFGPEGTLTRFVAGAARQYLDTEARPWRWKPEARFAGLGPESAAFFERATAVSEALFDAQGRLRLDLTLAALAERGRTMVAIGGEAAPVRASGAAAKLVWPGPEPSRGVEVSFREGPGAQRILHEGPWGLLRLMDTLRLRFREEGRRVLLDLRTEQGRVFLRMDMPDPVNPVSAREALRGLTCPPVL